MRPILLFSLFICLTGCIESNPQPSPGTGTIDDGNRDPDKNNPPGPDIPLAAPDAAWEQNADMDSARADVSAMDMAAEIAADAASVDVVALPDIPPDLLPDEVTSDVGEVEEFQQDILDDLSHAETTHEILFDLQTETAQDLTADEVKPGDITTLSGGGTSFGMCWGPCKQDFSIEGAKAHYIAAGWDETIFSDVSASLTDLGASQAKQIALDLVDVSLKDVYGCPDCADGGATHATLVRKGTQSTHAYPFNGPPPELEAANEFVMAILQAFAKCQSNDLVTIPDDCTPLVW